MARWPAGGSGRHERGPAGGVATTTSATGGRDRPRDGHQGGEQVLELVAGQRDQPQRRWVAGVLGDRGHHQEHIRQHGQDHPPIPGAPAANLVLVQAAQPLAGLQAPPPPASDTRPPEPGRPAAGRRDRRTRGRPARRCEGCGAPAASGPTRAARRRCRAAGGSTHTSGGPWRPARHSAAASTQAGPARPATLPLWAAPTSVAAARWP
jgi:hypothetical protein